jgi:Ankyrin repeats (many copies)
MQGSAFAVPASFRDASSVFWTFIVKALPNGFIVQAMRVLQRFDLAIPRKLEKKARQVVEQITRGDFRSAEVKKLSDGVHYRAKLDHENRLLLRFATFAEQRYCLVLELIENHAYERSRFLGIGSSALDEATFIDAFEPEAVVAEAIRYVHPASMYFYYLARPISFDDEQEQVLGAKAPLIVLGSAGSGKTAATLTRLRQTPGNVAYVTQSPYLADAARALYFDGYAEDDEREVSFLSFRDVLRRIESTPSKQVTFQDFRTFFRRHSQTYAFADAHRVFEEFRGVIGAQPEGPLPLDAYQQLGVRSSIFSAEQRPRIWDLFQKYVAWLAESGRVDSNLVSHSFLARQPQEWDAVLVDEVQDLTNVELALIMRGLRPGGSYFLVGDANQIVHPNFFSWANLRGMLYRGAAAPSEEEHVKEDRNGASILQLPSNYRNARRIVEVSNRILAIKKARFGSVDRESDRASEARAVELGAVWGYAAIPKVTEALSSAVRRSTRACVIVLRDEDREEAQRLYRTPLVFSVHEAKGLEYETVILHNIVSSCAPEFREVCRDVSEADVVTERVFARAKSKDDKSLEVYKFFVNALFVALTRAIARAIFVESQRTHPMFALLNLRFSEGPVDLARSEDSLERWQREARKLELQGKLEQAEAVRRDILRVAPVPWTVLDREKKKELEDKAIKQGEIFKKAKQQLWDVALFHDDAPLGYRLTGRLGYVPPIPYEAARAPALGRNHVAMYAGDRVTEVLALVDKHGVEFRSMMNLTPLMHAAYAGNVTLARALLDRGASLSARDTYGRTALHWLLQRSARVVFDQRDAALSGRDRMGRPLEQGWYRRFGAMNVVLEPDVAFMQSEFAAVYTLIAESYVDVEVDGKLVRIGRDQGEYFVLQTMFAFGRQILYRFDAEPSEAVRAATLEPYFAALPASVLSPARRARTYINAVLARSEATSNYPSTRRLWTRAWLGNYILNPTMQLRSADDVSVSAKDLFGVAATQEHVESGGPTSAWARATKSRSGHSAGVSDGPSKGVASPYRPLLNDPFQGAEPEGASRGLVDYSGAYGRGEHASDWQAVFPFLNVLSDERGHHARNAATQVGVVEAAYRLFDHAAVYQEKVMVLALAKRGLVAARSEEVLHGRAAAFERDADDVASREPAMVDRVLTRSEISPQAATFGRTLLHRAALYRNAPLVEGLLALGANPLTRDFYGATPLDYVLMSYRMERHIPGGADIVAKLMPERLTFMCFDRVEHAVPGSDTYAFLLLLLAVTRMSLSNNLDATEIDATSLSEAIALVGRRLFPLAATRSDHVTRAIRTLTGSGLLEQGRRGVRVSAAVRPWNGTAFVTVDEFLGLGPIRQLLPYIRSPRA